MSHKMSVIKVLFFFASINFVLAYNYELPTNVEQAVKQNSGSITTVTLKNGGNYYSLELLYIKNQLLEMEAAELLIDKLEGVPKLSILSLENNKISGTFDLGRLKNLKKLESFWINANKINKVVNTASENMPSVTILQLFDNNLSSIDFDIFDRFPNLEELGLNGNKFTGTLDLGKLKRLKRLKKLFFNKNNITEVVNTATEDMPSVTRIDIGENSLSFIDFQSFDKFPNLKELDLNKNKIAGTLDLGKLKWIKNLEEFDFYGNEITQVVNTATENMPSVTSINLANNRLSSIEMEIFDRFPNLEDLLLGKNKITGTLDLGKLKRLKSLKFFYFDKNGITEVVNTATENMPSVYAIYLYQNNLTFIDLNVFDKFINIEIIQLNRNQLISITGYEKADVILPEISYITISENNFVCSDLENMVSSYNSYFWYDEIETSCHGLKSQLFREISCCYPNVEDQMSDMQKIKYKQMPSKQPQY